MREKKEEPEMILEFFILSAERMEAPTNWDGKVGGRLIFLGNIRSFVLVLLRL